MKKYLFSLLVTVLLVSLSWNHIRATIWVDMEPQEVVDQADVIVVGKYDFSAERISSESTMPFCGIPFDVEKIYRGDVSDRITAGVDCYDTALIDEFQQDGGKLLLFLEKGGKTRYDTPVGGPNGIVQLKNGEVLDENEERREFFKEFLEEKNGTGHLFMYLTISIIAGFVVAVIVYRKKKHK
ncbi:hypothetical protein VBD025_16310 [Virgibacillus flavescens]|uniref:hypothetical protein n=1 Tax=Virgibacillus flavescens TaxID=1611422 RepID=UPI003D3433A5